MKIEIETQDRIDDYEHEVAFILEAVGMERADVLVTDGSMIGDFCDVTLDEEGRKVWISDVSTKLGMKVYRNEYIVDIAEKLRNGPVA